MCYLSSVDKDIAIKQNHAEVCWHQFSDRIGSPTNINSIQNKIYQPIDLSISNENPMKIIKKKLKNNNKKKSQQNITFSMTFKLVLHSG